MNDRAFTLIELLVVTSIILLLTALILPNYRLGDSHLAVQRSAHKISQDLRRAQEFAISVKVFGGMVPGGYGIYFDLDQLDRYVMFADLDSDQEYSGVNEKVEETILEGNVTLFSLSPIASGNSLNVFFAPPHPTTQFLPDAATAIINVRVGDIQGTVRVNKAGLIAVD